MSDYFCIEHGYEFMRCEKVQGAIPYCVRCDEPDEPDRATWAADHARDYAKHS